MATKPTYIFQMNNHFIGFKISPKKGEYFKTKYLWCNQEKVVILLLLLKTTNKIYINILLARKLNLMHLMGRKYLSKNLKATILSLWLFKRKLIIVRKVLISTLLPFWILLISIVLLVRYSPKFKTSSLIKKPSYW